MKLYEAEHYLVRVSLERDRVSSFEEYPFCLPVCRNLTELELHPSVTFVVGENGTGKSTLLKAIAVAWGLNPEGGSRGSQFLIATHSPIIMSYPDAWIYWLTEDDIRRVEYTETEHYVVAKEFLNNHETMLRILMSEGDG